MIYNMTSKGQVETLTSGQGHDLTQTYNDAYHSFVSIRQTRQTCFEACISSQSKVIARTLLATFCSADDVRRSDVVASCLGGVDLGRELDLDGGQSQSACRWW